MADLLVACPVICCPDEVDGWRSWDYSPMLVIDNSDDGRCGSAWRDLCADREWAYRAVSDGSRRVRANLGVAASWNLAMRYARRIGREFVALVSQTYRLAEGTSAFGRALDAGEHDWRGLLNGTHALHGCIWSVSLWERVGEFDERFWPAYYEDNDWLYRLRLLGLHSDDVNPMRKGEFPGVSLPAYALRDARVVPERIYGDNAARYRAKWGGDPGHETVTDPTGAR